MIADDDPRLDLHFLAVRQGVGLLGLCLPFMLLLYGASDPVRMQPTISDFYYTAMGDLFVGMVIAIGVFLISYKGYSAKPERFRLGDFGTSLIAGTAAILLALFPTPLDPTTALCLDAGVVGPCTTAPAPILLTGLHTTGGPLHYTAASVFFLGLAYFCLVLFPMGGKRRADGGPALSIEHLTYFVCGALIVAALITIGLLFAFDDHLPDALTTLNPVFWAESVAVWAFAIAWLTKGKMLTRPLGLGLGRGIN